MTWTFGSEIPRFLIVVVCKNVETVDVHPLLVMVDPRANRVRLLDERDDGDPVSPSLVHVPKEDEDRGQTHDQQDLKDH